MAATKGGHLMLDQVGVFATHIDDRSILMECVLQIQPSHSMGTVAGAATTLVCLPASD